MSFKATALFDSLKASFKDLSDSERSAQSKKVNQLLQHDQTKVNAIFQFDVKNGDQTKTWIIDLKNGAQVHDKQSFGDKKVDVTIAVSDSDLIDLATGKLNGQKAFTTGKLKVKGNIMQVTKVEGILKNAVKKSKI